MEVKIITVADADAKKLAELVRENAEYRPDYFGTLATTVLWQLNDYAYCECPSCHATGLPELFMRPAITSESLNLREAK